MRLWIIYEFLRILFNATLIQTQSSSTLTVCQTETYNISLWLKDRPTLKNPLIEYEPLGPWVFKIHRSNRSGIIKDQKWSDSICPEIPGSHNQLSFKLFKFCFLTMAQSYFLLIKSFVITYFLWLLILLLYFSYFYFCLFKSVPGE